MVSLVERMVRQWTEFSEHDDFFAGLNFHISPTRGTNIEFWPRDGLVILQQYDLKPPPTSCPDFLDLAATHPLRRANMDM